jgi:hypothetical protein
MTPDQWGALIGQFGVGGATVYVLYKVLSMVGERMIKAIDRVGEKIEQHIKEDLAAHAETSERLARIEKAIESDLLWRERTPVETPKPPGETLGRYHIGKKKGDG